MGHNHKGAGGGAYEVKTRQSNIDLEDEAWEIQKPQNCQYFSATTG